MTEWNDVNDGLPENSDPVLLLCSSPSAFILVVAQFNGEFWVEMSASGLKKKFGFPSSEYNVFWQEIVMPKNFWVVSGVGQLCNRSSK